MRILTGFEMPGRTQAPRTPGPLFEPARWEKARWARSCRRWGCVRMTATARTQKMSSMCAVRIANDALLQIINTR